MLLSDKIIKILQRVKVDLPVIIKTISNRVIEYTLATKASHSQDQNLARVWRWLLPPLIVVKLNVHALSQISLLCLILKMLLLAQSEYLTSKTLWCGVHKYLT